ncbi:MAG: acyl-CoA dehydrogenase, partial [Alphaproteobacteria bacterium]|nr:acyl-CoA dehydrogenase [Alphaproteobacteria bacterium]
MSAALKPAPAPETLVIADLLPTCGKALEAAETLLGHATAAVALMVRDANGNIDSTKLEDEQFAAHGLAWLATYVATLKESLHWAERLKDDGKLRELEQLILQAGFGEYLAQMQGGISMSQVEICRLTDLGVASEAQQALLTPAVKALMAGG